MRKLVVGTFLTLDGVMQAPGGVDEDKSGGFEYGGWMVPFFDDTGGRIMVEWIQRAGAFLLGRGTYEIFAAYWPQAPAHDPIAKMLNNSPKYVASRTLKQLEWKHSKLIEGDVAGAVKKLKAEAGGELQVHGSPGLIQTLLRNNLIDEFRIWSFPVVLGKGKRLFADGTIPAAFKLAETQTSTTGAVLHVYQTAGKPEFATFSIEERQGEYGQSRG